jgi:hypothetical protein
MAKYATCEVKCSIHNTSMFSPNATPFINSGSNFITKQTSYTENASKSSPSCIEARRAERVDIGAERHEYSAECKSLHLDI